jgi:hypothetical protein
MITINGVNTTETGFQRDDNGHLEAAIHGPLLPFGAVHTESLTPVFQADGVYGINPQLELATTSGTGTATTSDSMFVVSTGTTAGSQGVIQSRKRLRYRAGQGVVARFSTLFSTPVADSYQTIGVGHAEDGLYLGYVGTTFGLLYSHHGVRECRTLTVTTGSSTTENVVVRLNGTNYNVAVTNSGNIQRTVWEISQGTYAGWTAYPAGATVVFLRNSAGTASAGTYTLTGSTAVGTFAQTKAGAATSDVFVPQSSWNGDKLDGTGESRITANWLTMQVAELNIQYLGAGAFVVKAEICPTDANNATMVTLHTFRNPNSSTRTTFGNPSLPFTMAAVSAGSTTDVSVKCGSFAGFIEGPKHLHGNRFTYFNALTTVGASNFQALFTILNTRQYAGRSNQAVVNLLSVTGALKHTSPCIFYLIKNGSLVGNPNFASLSSNSCTLWDTTATTVTYSAGEQLLWTGHLGDTGELDHHFGNGSHNAEELTIQPGEWVTLAAKAVTGSPAHATGSINTREDQ